jgi:hypothetical protein
MRIGAMVEVEIVLSEKPDAISIPLECVHLEGLAENDAARSSSFNPFAPYGLSRHQESKPPANGQNGRPEIRRFVFVNDNGVARKRWITTGAANENFGSQK